MAVNKVIYNGETLIDITDTSIDVNKIPDGSVVYLASGERAVGNATVYTNDDIATVAETKNYLGII